MANPMPAVNFRINWGGMKGEFSEVTGLNSEHQVIENHHGLNMEYARKMPSVPTSGNITLKRGVTRAPMRSSTGSTTRT